MVYMCKGLHILMQLLARLLLADTSKAQSVDDISNRKGTDRAKLSNTLNDNLHAHRTLTHALQRKLLLRARLLLHRTRCLQHSHVVMLQHQVSGNRKCSTRLPPPPHHLHLLRRCSWSCNTAALFMAVVQASQYRQSRTACPTAEKACESIVLATINQLQGGTDL